MKLICEVNEDIEIISEANESGKKSYYIQGIFMQGNKENKNKRAYRTETLMREVDRYKRDYIEQNRAYGELGHPPGPTINLERVSHMIKELYQDGDNFIGKAKIMDTPYGNIVSNLMSEGARLGVSSRGLGSLKQKNGVMEVQDDFYLATPADIVADPSAPDAFVHGIMEGKEWIWDNGIIKENEISAMKDEIEQAASRRITEETAIKVFDKFMKKLSRG